MSRRLERILALHLDPRTGSPYWIERERELGFPIRQRVQAIDDLPALGPFDSQALVRRPVEDFLPQGLRDRRGLITGETGGATGAPKTTCYTPGDFRAAFITPFFRSIAGAVTFDHGHWLWLGPNGPHIIGKVAREIARRSTGSDGFSVDFDPRWYRRLTAGSVARARYLEHVREQALRIMRQQEIRYLFTTPVVLVELATRLDERHRQAVRFVYLGGMAIAAATLTDLGAQFPRAVFLAGYGNTLFGVCHETGPGRPDGRERSYYPRSERLVVRLVSADPAGAVEERLRTLVDYGQTGQVVMHRLDESCFLANVIERDCARRLRPAAGLRSGDGIGDPRPLDSPQFKVDEGIY